MSTLSVGIIGLPNVGKSTLFNALMKREIAKVGRHPFTTVSPNKGVIAVPDKRLNKIASIFKKPVEIRPASIEFVDIAGLVKGAAEGAGLGNQFLSHIREVDLILHVLREFENDQVAHVAGRVDPAGDAGTVDLELVLADFETVVKGIQTREKKARNDKKAAKQLEVLQKVKQALEQGKPAISVGLEEEEEKLISSFNLLTLKPVIFILNISEKHVAHKAKVKEKLPQGIILPVCIKLNADLYQLEESERKEYLSELGIKEAGLEELIKLAYRTLGLITFYTVKGEKKISAWSIEQGANAVEAAGAIHTDFSKRFIKAEVVDWQKLIKAGSWKKAKEKGKINLKGRDYLVKDGEVVEFKLSK